VRRLYATNALVGGVLGFLLSVALMQLGVSLWPRLAAQVILGAVLGVTLTRSYLRRREQAQRAADMAGRR
jgi:uncharacterized membrane protein AbrB (regulator of aidB expression)